MKWLIVEDALRDRKGHWLEYVSTFVQGLKALGDEVVVLCDRKAEGFVMAETGAIPVLPDSIWHRMGDGAGGLKRYLRVPGHAVVTFLAMRKVFRGFNHGLHGLTRMGREQVNAQGTCAGDAFSNPFTSELARDSENTSPTRSASGSASSPVTSHSLQATTPEASLPSTSYPLPATSIPLDWIFVPTVLVHHLLGWWLLLKTGSVPRESRVLLFFPNLPIRLDDMGFAHWNAGPTTKLMAWIFASFRTEVESGRVVLGVETHSMQRALEGLIQMPVAYLPHPVEFHAETRRRGGKKSPEGLTTEDTVASQAGAAFSNPSTSELSRDCENISRTRSATAPAYLPATSYASPATSAKPIVFGCYGAARWEKGSDIFQEAIKLILKNQVAGVGYPVPSIQSESACELGSAFLPITSNSLPATPVGRPLCFVIQWVEDFQDGQGNLVSIDPWLKNHPQVEVIGRYFQGDEYDEQLERTDVMVLPYRSPYRLRVSRVVIEAMMNGMPVIATRDTTLFEQAEEYGMAVGCDDGSAESLAKAILEVAESFGRLQEDARLKAKAVAESFSVRYFRELLSRLDRKETNL